MCYTFYRKKNTFSLAYFFRVFLLFIVGIGALSCANNDKNMPHIQKGVLDLRHYDFKKNIVLKGEWAFYPELLVEPATFYPRDFDNTHLLYVPAVWGHQKINGKRLLNDNYGSYALNILVKRDAPNLTLKVPSLGTAFTLYANNKVIAKNGVVGKTPSESTPHIVPLLAHLPHSVDTLHLVMHISNFYHKDGGFWFPMLLGKSQEIESYRNRNVAIQLLLAGCFLIMTFYHLGIFILRKKDVSALYFSLVSIILGIRLIITDERYLLHLFPNISWFITFRVEYLTIYGSLAMYVMFFQSVYPQEFNRKIAIGIQIICGLLGLTVLTTPTTIFTHFLIFGQVFILLSGFYAWYVLMSAIQNKREASWIFLIGFSVFFLSVVHDILYDSGVFYSAGYMASYGLLFFIFSQSFALSVKYTQNFLYVENLSRDLETKVLERTHLLHEKTKGLEEQQKIIQKKNDNIKSSINYASRIQKAILGDTKSITSNFKDSFILLHPKDIVSGDFYWYTEIKRTGVNALGEDHKTLFFKVLAVADCTGHGIPGAFMTVLGSTLLDEIINENRITSVSKSLDLLDKKLQMKLQKQGVNDGMDIGLVIIDEENKKLNFSGAHNPLFFVRNGELTEIKGAPFPIGSSHYKKKKFENHTITYQEGDIFYMFSDGYQDQQGKRNETTPRKYYKKNFRELLLKIHHLPCQQQHDFLLQEFNDWKEGFVQTDDILIVGFRF